MSRVPSLAEARRRAEATRRVKPDIEAPSGPAAIRALREAINAGKIPSTYVSSGRVVAVEKVSGTSGAAAGDEDSPLPVTASEVRAPELAALLAEHTFTFRIRSRKTPDGGTETYEEEITPPTAVLNAALAPKEWPDLRPLLGIVGAPVLRPDGTLLQQPGYDPATGLYLASKVPLEPVPEDPDSGQVTAARDFLLAAFLGDFPWVSEADKANYLGLLVTPILRSYLRTLIPFGVVTSTMPGSGKTILTCGLGMLYGQRVLTWTDSDEELRKAITSVLADPVGTIIFDNLAEGTVIDSPVLARLITDRTWADRLLGGNNTAAFANDRVWTATGNNLRLGGDMRTQVRPGRPEPGHAPARGTHRVRDPAPGPVDPRTRQPAPGAVAPPGPGRRLDAPGAPRRGRPDHAAVHPVGRGRRRVPGPSRHPRVPRQRRDRPRTSTTRSPAWTAFFAQWRKIHGDKWLTSNELRLSADIPPGQSDPWDGCFITDGRGQVPDHEVARQAAHRADQPLPRPVRAAQRPGQAHQGQHLAGRGVVRVSGVCGVYGARGTGPEISRARAGTHPANPAKPAKPRSEAGKACGVWG